MKRDRVAVDLVVYSCLCAQGTVDEVRTFLEDHWGSVDVNESSPEFDKNESTPLMVALKHKNEPVAKLLLVDYKAKPRIANVHGLSAIHCAVKHASFDMVELLIKHGARIAATSTIVYNASGVLRYALDRDHNIYGDEEAIATMVRIVHLILYHSDGDGSVIGLNTESPDGFTPLAYAARWHRTTEVVDLLLKRGADVNDASSDNGQTALMQACLNADYGVPMVKALLAAGATVTDKDSEGNTVMGYAYYTSPAVMQLILAEEKARGVPRIGFGHVTPNPDVCGDYMACASYAVSTMNLSYNNPDWAANALKANAKVEPNQIWALLRCPKRPNYGALFIALNQCTNPRTWHLVGCEIQSTLVSNNGHHMETILHAACRSPVAAAVLPVLMRLEINPLLRNEAGLLPLDLCPTPDTRKLMQSYMAWRPTPQRTRWWGPFFEGRAHEFMLVCNRFRPLLPKDVRYMIVAMLASRELACIDPNYQPIVQ